MAAKKKVPNKSQAIRDYKASHPDAQPKDIAAALEPKVGKITAQFVSTVLSNAKKGSAPKKNGKAKAKAVQSNGTLPEHIDATLRFIVTVGGVGRAEELIQALRSLDH